MKIRVTLDVPDAIRRALRRREGGSGLATRREILSEHHALWFAHMEDIAFDGAAPIEEEIEEGND
jgi:hypothetical protein